MSLAVSADAGLSAAAPNRSFARSRALTVGPSPRRIVWLAFDVPSLPGSALSARLQLTAVDGSLDELLVKTIRADAGRTERTITFNRGLLAKGRAGVIRHVGRGPFTIPLAPSALGHGGRVELALVAGACRAACAHRRLRVAGREAGVPGPRLVIRVVNSALIGPVGPAPAPSPAPAGGGGVPAGDPQPAPPADQPPVGAPAPTPPPKPDTTPPAVTMTRPASGATTSATPVFAGAAGTAPGDASTVTVRVYAGSGTTGSPVETLIASRSGGSWAKTSQPLASGPYSAQAEQDDTAGNVGLSGVVTFTVDATPPDTSMSGPSGPTNNPTPTFTLSSDDPTATFECSLDGAAFAACSSPYTTAPLSDGAHTFSARARDPVGNVDPTPATHSFTVDTVAPVVAWSTPAPGAVTTNTTPALAGSAGRAPGDEGSVAVSVYPGNSASGTPVQTLSSAVAPDGGWAVTPSALADGTYTARVTQSDAAGNSSAATRSFTIDTTPPDTSITSGPGAVTNDSTPTFRFSATESGSHFECGIDGSTLTACTSPHTLAALADGRHTFAVRAIDAAGNADPTPATHSFTVDTVAPAPTLTAPSAGTLTNNRRPMLGGTAGTAPGDASSVTVDVFAGPVTGSPVQTFSAPRAADGSWSAQPASLADGAYNARVRQADAAGNSGTATTSFTIDGTPPAVTVSEPGTDGLPQFTGAAGTAQGDASSVTVRLWAGSGTSGSPIQSPPASVSSGRWSAQATSLLDPGTYTVQAEQADAAGNTGVATRTFTVYPTIAAAGDIACDPGSAFYNGGAGDATHCRQQATSDLIAGKGFHRVLALGDNQYVDGALTKYQQVFDPTWGRFKSRISPVPGNHEYQWAAAGGYFDYFNGVGQATGPAGDRTKGWYSFDVGGWHVIALNSNCAAIDKGSASDGCAPGSPQEQWLAADLAAHSVTCTLAYWHHPRHSSRSTLQSAAVDPLWRDLATAGADLVLNGHAHGYERFAPMNAAGVAAANGMREIVAGTGGTDFHSFDSVAANSETSDAATFGVLRLTLRPGAYDWQFRPIPGSPSFTDSGTYSCH